MTERTSRSQRDSRAYVLWGMIVLGIVIVIGAVVTPLLRDRLTGWFTGASRSPVATWAEENPQGASTRVTGAFTVTELDFQELQRLLSALTPQSRESVVADRQAFRRFVQEESARRSVLRAAEADGLPNDERVSYLMDRAAEQILLENYIQLKARGGIAADYPAEAQIQDFYQNNQAAYTVEERVLLWQVFIPVPSGVKSESLEQLESLANTLAKEIREGKRTFTDAVLAHSGHEVSRLHGGFMGLLRVSQLVPEVRKAIPRLEEGQVSLPIRGADGFHIIKRGALIPAQVLPLAQVREQIQTQLRQAAQVQLRQAVLDKARRGFGEPLTEDAVEEWRLKFLAEGH